MNNTLPDCTNQLKRYDNIDGTGELFMGLMFLGFALAGYLEVQLSDDSPRWIHATVIYGIMIPVLAAGYWIRRIVRRHITWPRVGYAAYPRQAGKSWWIGIVVTFLVAFIVALGLTFLRKFARQHNVVSLPSFGILIALVAIYAFWVFRMSKEHRWKWIVLLLMVLGILAIALSFPRGSNELGWPFLLFLGLAWFGSGVGTLYSCLRHSKPAPPEVE